MWSLFANVQGVNFLENCYKRCETNKQKVPLITFEVAKVDKTFTEKWKFYSNKLLDKIYN